MKTTGCGVVLGGIDAQQFAARWLDFLRKTFEVLRTAYSITFLG